MSDKIIPKKTSETKDPERITTFVHNLGEGDALIISKDIDITLQRTQKNRATLCIRAPISVPIKRKRAPPK